MKRRNAAQPAGMVNAGLQYQEENDEGDLEGFLASAALASDADSKDTEADRVTLMTLHSSKGLEFPVVCLVGMEQGLFPSYRSLMIRPRSRRNVAFVMWASPVPRSVFSCPMPVSGALGRDAEPAVPSVFLSELPEALVQGDIPDPAARDQA